jgi:hypothetical protein
VHFLFSIDEDVIWPDPAIGCENNWAVAKAAFGLHPFGEIDLPVHVSYLISVSLTVSQHVNYNKTKELAERVGFEPRLSNKINKLGGANGIPNLRNSAKANNSTSYWTLNGR